MRGMTYYKRMQVQRETTIKREREMGTRKENAGLTREDFIQYLEERLIPDLKESGHEYTAKDFETAVRFMKGAK